MGVATYDKLYPLFRDILLLMDQKIKLEGLAAYPFCTFRSFDEQMLEYKKGRTFNEKKQLWEITDIKEVVTKAQPGLSFHQYGVAVDYVFDSDTVKPGVQWTWSATEKKWQDLGAIGKQLGLTWAGDWKNFSEKPHFEMNLGFDVNYVFACFKQSGIDGVWKMFDQRRAGKI